jgi:hypothetical protein
MAGKITKHQKKFTKKKINYHLRVAVVPWYQEQCTKLTKINIKIQAAQRKTKTKTETLVSNS